MRRRLSLALVTLLLTTLAIATARPAPARATGSTTLNGLAFPTGTNGCAGPLVAVAGDAAMQTYILSEARDYCASYPPSQRATAPDVEVASLQYVGSACVGMDWAADYSDANDVGLSVVYPNACAGSYARRVSNVSDTQIGVNVVDSIATCPGANVPNGGYPGTFTAPLQPCLGNEPATNGSRTYPAPNNESVETAQLLWNGTYSDYAQAGGTAGFAPILQQQSSGNGSRITWCYALYNAQDTSCVNNTQAGTARDESQELTDVCGNPYSSPATGAVVGTIGDVSRASLAYDPRQPTPVNRGPSPVGGCGIVTLNGGSGYNGVCDPTNPTAVAGTYGTNPESGVATCNGDLEVAQGAYAMWGCLHVDLNAAATTANTNAAAQGFLNFLQSDPDDVQELGFLQSCQMLNTRASDGGPYSPSQATC